MDNNLNTLNHQLFCIKLRVRVYKKAKAMMSDLMELLNACDELDKDNSQLLELLQKITAS